MPISQERIDFIRSDYYGWMVTVHGRTLAERYGLRLVTRDEIMQLYRILLGRDPENEAIYRNAEGRILFADLRADIINSAEYREIT